jgi:CelD/BcsL family acetyltransferase involved in cellulose biosynthesis
MADGDASAGSASVHTDLGRIGAVEPEWRRLAEGRGNAFVTPEWARCWFSHYGSHASPLITVLSNASGSIQGVMPLAVHDAGHPRMCAIPGANLGDRFHPVCDPGDEPAVGEAAGRVLASEGLVWSVVALDHVDTASGWVEALLRSTPVRLTRFERVAAGLPLIDLSAHGDWEAFLGTMSANLRQQVRRFPRRAERRYSVRIRRTQRAEELSDDLDTFFRLHDLRFRGSSSLSTESARAFLADFAHLALERGWLRLWFLELDGRAVSAWYGWKLGTRYSHYNSGFDPDFSADRPGLVLLASILQDAFREGAAEFDFLLGDEDYKYRFADGRREVSDVMLTRSLPHPATALVAAEYGARRIGRLVPPGARQRLGLTRLARRSLFRRKRD